MPNPSPTPPATVPASARHRALQALCLSDPQAKVDAAHALQAACLAGLPIDPEEALSAPAGSTLPGRPETPALVSPKQVPHRSPFTPDGLAGLLHAIAHIEFNAINLALDAVWRFPGMPEHFYRDWLRVADEEATHFGLLREYLQGLGHDYGDFPAHDGLWEMCVKTQDDVTARMALVPRTLEARGLDATPLIQTKLRAVGTPDALATCDILDIILRDEIGHVAIGNHWYRGLCEREGLEPVAHYKTLARLHKAPRLKGPFNTAARQRAGFTEAELAMLAQGAEN